MGEPTWTYWCPAEGDHVVDPRELCVGIVSVDDEGVGHALLVAAILPPLPVDHFSQAEPFAIVIRDALAAQSFTEKDGLAAWCSAHGLHIDWPTLKEPTDA